MLGGRSWSAVTTPGSRDVRKGTRTRPPTTGVCPFTRYVNVISSGTGRATSQKEDIKLHGITQNRTAGGSRWVGDGRMASSERCRYWMRSPETQPQKPRLPHRLPAPVLSFCARLLLFRQRHSQVFHHHLQIFPGFLFLTRIAKQIRRMIRDSELRVLEIVNLAAQVNHCVVYAQQCFSCDCS